MAKAISLWQFRLFPVDSAFPRTIGFRAGIVFPFDMMQRSAQGVSIAPKLGLQVGLQP